MTPLFISDTDARPQDLQAALWEQTPQISNASWAGRRPGIKCCRPDRTRTSTWIHDEHRLNIGSQRMKDVDDEHWDPSVFTDSGLDWVGGWMCVYVLCTYMCVCVRYYEAKVHQHPFLYLFCKTTWWFQIGKEGADTEEKENWWRGCWKPAVWENESTFKS